MKRCRKKKLSTVYPTIYLPKRKFRMQSSPNSAFEAKSISIPKTLYGCRYIPLSGLHNIEFSSLARQKGNSIVCNELRVQTFFLQLYQISGKLMKSCLRCTVNRFCRKIFFLFLRGRLHFHHWFWPLKVT